MTIRCAVGIFGGDVEICLSFDGQLVGIDTVRLPICTARSYVYADFGIAADDHIVFILFTCRIDSPNGTFVCHVDGKASARSRSYRQPCAVRAGQI